MIVGINALEAMPASRSVHDSGSQAGSSLQYQQVNSLPKGSYQVQHIQRSPKSSEEDLFFVRRMPTVEQDGGVERSSKRGSIGRVSSSSDSADTGSSSTSDDTSDEDDGDTTSYSSKPKIITSYDTSGASIQSVGTLLAIATPLLCTAYLFV
ncbi:hypothetical protein CBS101457_006636 [Exobasidium rhododendri]|nr:hypothetical protein CBS101457_006636 [Exobasidium rhododendri]